MFKFAIRKVNFAIKLGWGKFVIYPKSYIKAMTQQCDQI